MSCPSGTIKFSWVDERTESAAQSQFTEIFIYVSCPFIIKKLENELKEAKSCRVGDKCLRSGWWLSVQQEVKLPRLAAVNQGDSVEI